MLSTRSLVALVATALLALPSAAVAQTQTDTAPLGDYSQPETTSTVETTPPPASETAGTTEEEEPAETTPAASGGGAPTTQGAAAPAQTQAAPTALAFTGFEAGFVALIGVMLMGSAVVLQRRRRTS